MKAKRSCFRKLCEIQVTSRANSGPVTQTANDLSVVILAFFLPCLQTVIFILVSNVLSGRLHSPMSFAVANDTYVEAVQQKSLLSGVFKERVIFPNLSGTFPISTCCPCIIIKSTLHSSFLNLSPTKAYLCWFQYFTNSNNAVMTSLYNQALLCRWERSRANGSKSLCI